MNVRTQQIHFKRNNSNKNRSPFRDNLRVPYFRYQKPNRDYRINVLSSYDKSVVDKTPLVQPKISITPAPPKKPLNLQESNIDAKEFNSIKVFVPLDLKRPKSKKKISENVIQREEETINIDKQSINQQSGLEVYGKVLKKKEVLRRKKSGNSFRTLERPSTQFTTRMARVEEYGEKSSKDEEQSTLKLETKKQGKGEKMPSFMKIYDPYSMFQTVKDKEGKIVLKKTASNFCRSSSSRNYNEISVKTSYTNRVVEKLDNLNKSNKLLIKSSLKGASRIIEKVIKNRKQSLNQDL